MHTPKTKIIIFSAVFCLLLFATPFFASSAGLVPCGGSGEPPCSFSLLIELIQRIINFLLIIAAPIASILFAYAGFLYLTAGEESGKISKAHDVFLNVLIGIVIALAAWLVVNTINNALLKPGYVPEGIKLVD